MANDPKKSQNRLKKEATVAQFSEKVAKSHAVVLTNYKGLTHQQLEDIKKAVKKLDAEYIITKNTLLKIALTDNKYEADPIAFDQPTATLFAYADVVLPLKELAKRIKELKMPEVKVGLIDGQQLTSDEVIKLSSLPSKEILLGQLVGTLKSPIFGLHRALNWNVQNLVMTLKAVASKKPA